jgi:hypothetical protein
MFVLTTLVYPVVLALLCLGAALLVDRAGGGWLPGALLPVVGAAVLIVVSQWTTYIAVLAPATVYLLVAVALTGFALGWGRVRGFLSRIAPTSVGASEAGISGARSPVRSRAGWWIGAMALAYLLALAPVLAAGRPTFSSYMALADSAVHMLGADYLIRHGQDYSHLDLRNSYGAFVHAYYGSSYPSGADTLFGGSSFLLGLPLIWTFQPFVAFMLAAAAGPAWLLVRRVGLDRWWGTLATLTVCLPALVYAYELIGSVKEIVSLPMILGMGALVVGHRRWLYVGARRAIPFALLVGAGISALGVAFGAWALAAAIVLGGAAIGQLARPGSSQRDPADGDAWPGESTQRASVPGVQSVRGLAGLLAVGVGVLFLGAWPTWTKVAGSLEVAEAISSTSNSGNLHIPLRASQILGVWLGGSYKLEPSGIAMTLTSVLIAVTVVAVAVGLGYAVRSRWFALAAWFALSIVLWLALKQWATTWADAKTLMLTSPVVVLAAWTGVAAIRSSPVRVVAPLAALLLAGGVLGSDALLSHDSNLAPTARYEELASIDTRFAGGGPTLFTDFDEYALYELRDMDVGGPDFVYPPPALAAAAGGYGKPVQLNRIAPSALAGYPLIVTRRDPGATRPPAAYRLLWRGVYYEVWGRRPHAPPALVHVVVSAPPTRPRAQCAQVARIAGLARSYGASRIGAGHTGGRLLAALGPELVNVRLGRTHRPPGWGLARHEIVMGRPGALRAGFSLPHGGVWELWLKGEVMRAIHVAVDGRTLGSIGGQLDGDALVANPLTPLRVTLSAGSHILTIARPGANLAPGDGGAAVLTAIFLVPVGSAGEPSLRSVAVGGWRSLCGRRLQWVELAR